MTIKITIKTLDSRNYDFEVEDDLTVSQFKQRIEPTVNVSASEQRLIFCGRVLQDDSKLLDYDCHTKVIHLVQRAPPSLRNNGNDPGISANDSNNNSDNVEDLYLNGQNQPRFRIFGDDTNVSFSAMTLSPDNPIDADAMRQLIQGVLTYANQSRLPDDPSLEFNFGVPPNGVHRRIMNAGRMLRLTFSAIDECERQLSALHALADRGNTNSSSWTRVMPNIPSLESVANERLDYVYYQLLECLAKAEDLFRPLSQKHREVLSLSVASNSHEQNSANPQEQPTASHQEPSTSTQSSVSEGPSDKSNEQRHPRDNQTPTAISEINYQEARVLCQFVPRIMHHLGHACHALSDFSTDLRRHQASTNSQNTDNQETVQVGLPSAGIAVPHVSIGFGPIPLSNVRVHSSNVNPANNDNANRPQSQVTLSFETQRHVSVQHGPSTVQSNNPESVSRGSSVQQATNFNTSSGPSPARTPSSEHPLSSEPLPTESVTTGSVTIGPVTTGSVTIGPVTIGSVTTGPVTTRSVTTGSVTTESTTTESTTTESATTESVTTGTLPAGPTLSGSEQNSQSSSAGQPGMEQLNQNAAARGRRQPVGVISGTIPTPDLFDYYLPCHSRWARSGLQQRTDRRQRTGSEPPPVVRQTQSSTQSTASAAPRPPNAPLNQQTQTRPSPVNANIGHIPINIGGLIENAMNSFMSATAGQQAANSTHRAHHINIIQNLGVIPEIARNAASAAVSQFFAAAAATPANNAHSSPINRPSAPNTTNVDQPTVSANADMMDVDNDSNTDHFVDACDNGFVQTENRNPTAPLLPPKPQQQPVSSRTSQIDGDALNRVLECHQEWLPIIEEDIRIQERLNPADARPLSDGYINSVPKKKRRLLKVNSESVSILQPSSSQSIEALLMRAINTANISSQSNPSVVPIVAELAADTNVQSAYDEHVRNAVGNRLKRDSNYDPKRFEHSNKYFK